MCKCYIFQYIVLQMVQDYLSSKVDCTAQWQSAMVSVRLSGHFQEVVIYLFTRQVNGQNRQSELCSLWMEKVFSLLLYKFLQHIKPFCTYLQVVSCVFYMIFSSWQLLLKNICTYYVHIYTSFLRGRRVTPASDTCCIQDTLDTWSIQDPLTFLFQLVTLLATWWTSEFVCLPVKGPQGPDLLPLAHLVLWL